MRRVPACLVTNYTYDYTAPLTYDSQGNRLVYSDTRSGGAPAATLAARR